MMVRFEENEYMIMAMFQKENRQQTMRESLSRKIPDPKYAPSFPVCC